MADKNPWSSDAYFASSASRKRAGISDFAYDDDVRSGRASDIHETLDPKKMRDGIRESRDSDENPESLPIAVLFDVTGSMGNIPVTFQGKLPNLMDVILAKAQIKYPHILVGAIGDATCDRFPFQVGQFESDNRFDEQLRNIILEGGGGGQDLESYGLAFRFAAYHTATDSFEKRGKKGYVFTIGDERPWPVVSAEEVRKVFGVQADADESVEDLIAKASEKWELFHIFPQNAQHGRSTSIQNRWRELLGERFVMLEDESLVCEVIAGFVYSLETAYGVDRVVDDLGLKGDARTMVTNALVPFVSNRLPGNVSIGSLPAAHRKSSGGVTRF